MFFVRASAFSFYVLFPIFLKCFLRVKELMLSTSFRLISSRMTIEWSTVSNALEKSAKAISVNSPFFIARIMSSLIRKITLVVE